MKFGFNIGNYRAQGGLIVLKYEKKRFGRKEESGVLVAECGVMECGVHNCTQSHGDIV